MHSATSDEEGFIHLQIQSRLNVSLTRAHPSPHAHPRVRASRPPVSAVERGVDVIVLDTDAVIFADPFPPAYTPALAPYTIIGLLEHQSTNAEQLNSGTMFIR